MCLEKCYFLKGYAFLNLSHYHCLLRRKYQSEFLKSMVPSTSNLSTQESSAVLVWKHLVKAMFFPVVMYGYEHWTRKKAECWRIDAFELWCWRRLLRVPWTVRTSNQSILKVSPEYPLVGLMLTLKLQYFGYLCKELTRWKRPWCWERLKAAGEADNRGWDGWMTSLTQWIWVWESSGSC